MRATELGGIVLAAMAAIPAWDVSGLFAQPPAGQANTKAPQEPQVEIVRCFRARDVGIFKKFTASGGKQAAEYEPGVAVDITDVTGKKALTLYMKAADDTYKTVYENLKKAKPGDCLKVIPDPVAGPGGIVFMKHAEPYDLRPGEELPNVYVFIHKVLRQAANNAAITCLLARKMGKEYVLALPHKSSGGKLLGDAGMAALVEDLKDGDTVEATLRDNMGEYQLLAQLKKYVPPERAAFVEVRKTTVRDSRCDAVVLQKDDKELVFPIIAGQSATQPAGDKAPAQGAPVELILARAGKMKKGDPVEFRAAAYFDLCNTLTCLAPAALTPIQAGQIASAKAIATGVVKISARAQLTNSSINRSSQGIDLPTVNITEVGTTVAVPVVIEAYSPP
ncbi:MAG: hypothetical protein HZA50_00930 [Planctomycetes bacterium]|nr:hypothetical protein [Planctomycetota bacterium]